MNKYLISFLLIFSLIPSVPCAAYGEVTLDSEITVADETVELPEYNEWLNTWQQVQATSTANVMLTPGSSEKDLNFAWYSTDIGTPAVMITRRFLGIQNDYRKYYCDRTIQRLDHILQCQPCFDQKLFCSKQHLLLSLYQ